VNEIDALKKVKEVILELLTEARELSKNLSEQPKAQMFVNAKIEILQAISFSFHKLIKEEVFDMGRMKSEIKVISKGKIEELMISKRGGTVEPRILEEAKNLQPGDFAEFDSTGITYSNFDQRVRSLVKSGSLDPSFRPVKRGNRIFLVRDTADGVEQKKEKREVEK
jgi:hypothetical protein